MNHTVHAKGKNRLVHAKGGFTKYKRIFQEIRSTRVVLSYRS